MILLAQVGNTNISAALSDGEGITGEFTVASTHPEMLGAIIDRLNTSVDVTLLASVFPEVTDTVIAVIEKMTGKRPLVYRRDIEANIEIKTELPERTGDDRVLAALGARKVPGGPCVIIDAGTAITVDALDAEGAFAGGVIMPGTTAAIEAMSHAAQLPIISFNEDDVFSTPAKNTIDAMKTGVVRGLAGGVDRVVEDTVEWLGGGGVGVVACGGGLQMLLPFMRTEPDIRKNLVLEGLLEAYRIG